jgi:hypothetical protein
MPKRANCQILDKHNKNILLISPINVKEKEDNV